MKTEPRLTIGAYCLAEYARSEAHIRDIARCGIDVVIGVPCEKELLDHFARYGVGAVVNGVVPGWFGGMGENAGTMAQTRPLEAYNTEKFEDHPAIVGIDIGDEPSMLDFPHYGKVYERVKELFPHQFPYLNLYPGYGMVASNRPDQIREQLGTSDFAEYMDSYCRNVPADAICFDFYPYSADMEQFWENLRIVGETARRYGRGMRVVLQVNSHVPEVWTSENRLRLQAYSALVFGAEWILWACYTAGWWYNQVLDERGEKTRQYDRLCRVNQEVKLLAKQFMKYQPTTTYHIQGEQRLTLMAKKQNMSQTCEKQQKILSQIQNLCAEDSEQLLKKLPQIENLHAENGEHLLIGERSSAEGTALLICAADDPYDECGHTYRICFEVKGKTVQAYNCDGEIEITTDENGITSVPIRSCGGILLTVSDE